MARRKGRSALTASGICLGVGLLFSILVSQATVNRALDKLAQAWNGRTDVILAPVGSGTARLPMALAERTRKLPQVEVVSPVLDLPAQLVTPGHTVGGYLAGLIPAEDAKLAPTRLVHGRLQRPGAPEVIVSRAQADLLGVDVGSTVRLGNAPDAKAVTVVGVYQPVASGVTSAPTLITSLEYAQAAGGKPGVVSYMAVALRKGTDPALWVDRHRPDVGPGVDPQVVRSYSSGFRQALDNIEGAFAATAAVSLFVGAFLIYLTLSIAVLERIRLYGTLRAMGAYQGQVRRLVLAEAAVMGVVSSAAGLVVGFVLSGAMIRLTASGVHIPPPRPVVPVGVAAMSFAVGVLTTVVAALIPARRAARMTAVDAMRTDRPVDTSSSRWPYVGFASIAAGLIGYAVARPTLHSLTAFVVLILVGAVLAVPLILRPAAMVVGRLTRRLAPGVGRISVMHLVKERSQSASTLALVMVVLTVVFTVIASYASNQRESHRILDKQYGADVQLYAGTDGFDSALQSRLLSTPGVARSTPFRFGNTRIGAQQLRLIVIDPASYFEMESYPWLHGSDPAAKAALASGGGVLLTAPDAARLGLQLGDTVNMETVDGDRPFRVAGVYEAMGFGGGHVGAVVGLADGAKWFHVGNPNGLDVVARHGTPAATLRSRLLARNGGQGFFATTNTRVKADSERQLNGIFAVFFAIVLVGVIVGMLGLANTLAASVLQRYREIGVLRSVGTDRSQVRGIVLAESATLVGVAFLLSLPLGFILSRMVVQGSSSSLHYALPYVYPWKAVPVLVVLALVVGTVAAVAPARRAARLDPVAVLRFD